MHQLPGRIDAVLRCLYLLFNEGYNSSPTDQLIREELFEEAMHQVYILTKYSIIDLPGTRERKSGKLFEPQGAKSTKKHKGYVSSQFIIHYSLCLQLFYSRINSFNNGFDPKTVVVSLKNIEFFIPSYLLTKFYS